MNKLYKRNEVYVVQYNEKILVIHYDCNRRKYWDRENVIIISDGDLHTILVGKVHLINITSIETIIIDPLLINYKFTSCSSLFSSFTNLKRIIGLEYLNTSEVDNMKYMFKGCKSLISLDLRGFDTSKVTDMSCMFSECYSLKSLDVSNFDTSNVTNMNCMFDGCKSLASLNLSNFRTLNVMDMSWMFSNCESLTSINVRNFDTSKVTSMYKMFAECKSLTELDLSSFNTSKVTETDMQSMFSYCENLKIIYV